MTDDKPTHLDLFSGIGGFSLAFEASGFRTVGFAEINEYPSKILRWHWPNVPNHGDFRNVPREYVDVVTAGVPCQPASCAGKMRGVNDERWLWDGTIDIVGEIGPAVAVFENVSGLLTLDNGRAFNGILSRLAEKRFDVWWDVFPAAAFGAGHLRERVFLVGSHAASLPKRIQANEAHAIPAVGGSRAFASGAPDFSTTADAVRARLQGHARNGEDGEGRTEARRPVAPPDLRGRVHSDNWWHEAHTGIPVLADGLPNKLVEAASLCIGDSIVPQVVVPLAKAIYQILRPTPQQQ